MKTITQQVPWDLHCLFIAKGNTKENLPIAPPNTLEQARTNHKELSPF